jgi:hypothetical protein
MKKTPVRKSLLLTLIVLLFSVLLTGCIEIVPPPPTDTGTVKIEVTGNYVYDIYMDGDIEFEDKIPGTYTLYNVPEGNHEFKAVDVMGASFGEDKDTIYVNAGQINYVYLSPASITPEPTTGSLKVVIMDDPGWEYEVYLGNQDTGEYLGNTSGSSIVGQNSATFTDIPAGIQTIFVISEDGLHSKYRFPNIIAGETVTINVYVQ